MLTSRHGKADEAVNNSAKEQWSIKHISMAYCQLVKDIKVTIHLCM